MRQAILAIILGGASVAFGQNVIVLSSASYTETVAPGSAATVFGFGLAGDVVVQVDGHVAVLTYVSDEQINFVVPRLAAAGMVEIVIRVDGNVVAIGSMRVARVAPGIFSMDGSGSGSGAILNSATGAGAPFPTQTVELPGCDKRTRLTLFATGIRDAGVDAVEVVLDSPTGASYPAPVEFAGASEIYPGVDEVRFVAPEEATAATELTVRLVAEEVSSNPVTVALALAEAPSLECSEYGAAFVYNTVADLLAGDLWDVTSADTVFADLNPLPAGWEVSGVGTTALTARNGEVIASGFAGLPELVWSDPEFPPTVRTLTDEPIPFLGVAAGNPVSVVVAEAEPGVGIHQQILALVRENGLAFAGIRVSGRLSPVSYSIAHNLMKQGTPLTDPTVDKAPFQLFFTADQSAEWELSGFYAAAASVQELVSVRGAPVHLHGFQLDRSRAGHIGSALVEFAEIRLYPLAAPTVRDADLTIRNLAVGGGRVSFETVNEGDGTVTRTSVQGLAAGRVVFQVELSNLQSGEPRMVAVDLPAPGQTLQVVVDPFNDVLESNESNNVSTAP